MEFYEKRLEEIYQQFGTTPERGIDERHVQELRTTYGANALTREQREAWWRVLARQFSGMLIYILLAAALISGFMQEWIDTAVIAAILLLNGVIGFWQEWKAQASIEALRKMASSKATVLRDGKTVEVDATELVPGDILILQTGSKIPADARIIEEAALETQEGALTGESTPVAKHADDLHGELALGDQRNMLFAGTIITKGRAKAVVVATGMKTQIGTIAHLIQETDVEPTPLQKHLGTLGSRLGTITVAICAVIFAVILFAQARAFTIEKLHDAFLLAVSLAVAAIPEGLPIVVTIALAFGTQRMARKHALIKRLASVETLGSTTVICTDKTGTLTKNEMTVTRLWHAGKVVTVDGSGYGPEGSVNGTLPRVTYEIGTLCNDAQLTETDGMYAVHGDPTEGCLLTLARKAGFSEKELRTQHPRIGEVPFDSERKRMSTAHPFGDSTLLLTKGAPDIVLQHCTRILDTHGERPLTDEDRRAILEANESFAGEALRVLAFAFRSIERKDRYGEEDECDLVFVSLVGMIDPPRPEAKEAMQRCTEAGIRVVMITGDHKATAVAIATELGLRGDAVEGSDLDDIDLDARVEEIGVYARVNPEHKMAIIEALKRKGHIVAMTGDGVNDAPALKRADIGIAMGITGTDVAKESASMILTDDNFASIVNAVEEGRKIYTNIKKFVNYLLSSNFAEVLALFFSVLLFTFDGDIAPALTVTMLLYMNLLTDSLPALALGVDPGDAKVMTRPPRDPKEPIITHNMFANIVLIGLLVAGATLLVFHRSLEATGSLAHAQTAALTTLVVLEIVRLAMIRKQYNTPAFSNGWLVLAVGAVFALQLAVLYTPLRFVFDTVPLAAEEWMLIALVAAVTYVVGMAAGALVRKVTGQHD